MIRIRRATVLDARSARPGVTACRVATADGEGDAIAYDDLVGPVRAGDVVLLNTTAVTLGLGTGGVHFVMAVEGREGGEPAGRAVKLRYTPVQAALDVVEERERDAIDAVRSLDGLPVVAAGLHSALAAAAIGIRAAAPDARVVHVMTDGAALHLGFSELVPALRAHGLLDATITAGQAIGGDHEAVTLHGALVAARAVERADVVVVAMGPGNLGTGSRWGFALLEVAEIVNAVAALGGRPIVAPRVSFADARDRHRGVSHHTTTALAVALARAEVALPPLTRDRAAQVRAQLAPIADRHALIEVDLGDAERALETSPVPLRSMGRSYTDDPDAFRAAAAAGVLAGRAVATSTR